MKTVIIVQARMNSSRLPGKVLRTVLGKTLLEYQIERLQRVPSADSVVIATTIDDCDQPIVDLCEKLKVNYFRGPEEDVLQRYYNAAQKYEADIVVRITADCPIIDPNVIDRVIKFYLDNYKDFDYVSNILTRSYPRGMDTEVFSLESLEQAALEAKDEAEREHVTVFIYNHPERYRLANVPYHKDFSRYRWTVDTLEDFSLIEKIITSLYPQRPNFVLEDCLELINKHPEWEKLNSHIEQKKLYQ